MTFTDYKIARQKGCWLYLYVFSTATWHKSMPSECNNPPVSLVFLMVSNDPVAVFALPKQGAKKGSYVHKRCQSRWQETPKVHKGFVCVFSSDVSARCKSCLVLHEEHEHAAFVQVGL